MSRECLALPYFISGKKNDILRLPFPFIRNTSGLTRYAHPVILLLPFFD